MSNKQIIEVKNGVPIWAWTKGVPFEAQARAQVERMARLPHAHHHIAVMPDVHAGYGSTVGSVIATTDAVSPAFVGVDVGCGMSFRLTSLTTAVLDGESRKALLANLRRAIEKAVPHGRTHDGKPGVDRGAWFTPPERVSETWFNNLSEKYAKITAKHPGVAHAQYVNHLGTLGTGNHFIEVVQVIEARRMVGDPENAHCVGRIGILLHSGSRGPGNKIGSYFTRKAKESCDRAGIRLEDPDLAYFTRGESLFQDYVEAVLWAQDYAWCNRVLMMSASLMALRATLGSFEIIDSVDCHHNYVSPERHYDKDVLLTRKGAVRASRDMRGVIPGSMGARSYVVKGLGNPESFETCSHGAGRAMSRTEAKKKFTVEDHQKATAGIECLKDASVLDETPGAYKSIEAVMAAQDDLVETQLVLSQLVCVKGGEEGNNVKKWQREKEERRVRREARAEEREAEVENLKGD
jgi:tRNA-splicing ligase RtcB